MDTVTFRHIPESLFHTNLDSISRFTEGNSECDNYCDLLEDDSNLEHSAVILPEYIKDRSIVPVAVYNDLVVFNVFHGTTNIDPNLDRQYAFVIPFLGKGGLFDMYLSGRDKKELPRWKTEYLFSANPSHFPNHLMVYNIIYEGVSSFDFYGETDKSRFLLKLTWESFTELVKLGKQAIKRAQEN